MPILLIILALTLGLAWRVRVVQRCWNPGEVEGTDEANDMTGMLDAYMRSSILVLVSLIGLFALGVAMEMSSERAARAPNASNPPRVGAFDKGST